MTEPGEHYSNKYVRYHSDIYMPEYILEAVISFLPAAGVLLPLSSHYRELQKGRHLPLDIYMPDEFDIVDVTLERRQPVDQIWRVCIRFPWSESHILDMVLVLQEDLSGRPTSPHEVVSAYWNARDDRHLTLDVERYVESPAKAEFDEARP